MSLTSRKEILKLCYVQITKGYYDKFRWKPSLVPSKFLLRASEALSQVSFLSGTYTWDVKKGLLSFLVIFR